MNNQNEISCRFCGSKVTERFIDIWLPIDTLSITANKNKNIGEVVPYTTFICSNCFLIQVDTPISPTKEHIFLSSFSSNWLTDVKWFSDRLFKRIENTKAGVEVELLDHTDTTENKRGDNAVFFGKSSVTPLIELYGRADLLLCHEEPWRAPDVADFLNGVKLFLKPLGIAIMKFNHLLPLLQKGELQDPFLGPFNFFSFTTISMLLSRYGLDIFDVSEYDTPPSLVIKVKHKENSSQHFTSKVRVLYGRERDAGMSSPGFYQDYLKRMHASTQLQEL